VLVVANLGEEPAVSPILTLTEGPLCEGAAAQVLFGEGVAAIPALNAGGGFDAYTPVIHLGPREAVVVQLRSR
jgi:hypothetical protein